VRGVILGIVGLAFAAILDASPAVAQIDKNEGTGELRDPDQPGASLLTPIEAFRSGQQALRQGRIKQALTQLEYAAEQGVPGAVWQLGRMYADGNGVELNKRRAYEYFRRLISTTKADDSAGTPDSPFLANAFVTLGQYHLEGIPGLFNPDAKVAAPLFRYAASYFADSEAQYNLGRLYLEGNGVPKDPIQAMRWLQLAAKKGEHRAQALLGTTLFKGEKVPRQAGWGLFWLIVAKDNADADEKWITEAYNDAVAKATDKERTSAYRYLENWLKGRRE
jgi:TPR repeat protein